MRYALFLFVLLNLLPVASAAQTLPIIDPPDVQSKQPQLPTVDEMHAILFAEMEAMPGGYDTLREVVIKNDTACRISELVVRTSSSPSESKEFLAAWQDLAKNTLHSMLWYGSLQIRFERFTSHRREIGKPQVLLLKPRCVTTKPKRKK